MAANRTQTSKQLCVTNRDEWRSWLEKNHAAKKEIWLVFFRKDTGKPSILYEDAVEEALCFGWIDGIVRKIDSERYCQKFTPRKDKSVWSVSNKARVEKMMRQGRMTEAGLATIEAAKRSGQWDETLAGQKLKGRAEEPAAASQKGRVSKASVFPQQ